MYKQNRLVIFGTIVGLMCLGFWLFDLVKGFPEKKDLTSREFVVYKHMVDTTYSYGKGGRRTHYSLRIIMRGVPIFMTFSKTKWMRELNLSLYSDSIIRVWYQEPLQKGAGGNGYWDLIESGNVYQVGNSKHLIMKYEDWKAEQNSFDSNLCLVGFISLGISLPFLYKMFSGIKNQSIQRKASDSLADLS